jgi:hypothetical protein
VALGAFGLDADINNRAFLRKVLQDGSLSGTAFAAKLADKRYMELSAAFGFGDFAVSRNQIKGFAEKFLPSYRQRQFEIAVGNTSDSMRLALNAEREVKALAGKKTTEDARWYTVMGNTPLRTVFQTAFSLPSSFASLDIDRQLNVLKDRARRLFGDEGVAQFSDPAKLEALLRRYLTQADQAGGSLQGNASALQMLQPARGGSGLLSILY